MIDQVIEWLRGQYGSNDFLVGTTLPFVLGGIVYSLRSTVRGAYSWFVRNFTVSIRINSATEHYEDVNKYVYDNFVWGLFKRNFVMTYLYSKSALTMTAGYGRSLALYRGCPGFVELESESSDSRDFKEHLTIKVLTWRPTQTAELLKEELLEYVNLVEQDDTVGIYKSMMTERSRVATKPKRPLDTIFIPDGIKDRVMGTLNKFIGSEQAYVEKGLPWHLGLILYGPPGTGKTSFIHAIASELGRDIHYHSSGSLAHVYVDPKKSILVLEDFDSADFETSDDEDKKTTKSTLSDTLNYLDGFLTPHGLIVIATTNHLDRLSPAVMRPGRFDLVQHVPAMDEKQYHRMCAFYGVEPKDDFNDASGAELMAEIKQSWTSDV